MSFLDRQLGDPSRRARLKLGCYVGLAVVLLADVAVPLVFHEEHAITFESWPAFGSVLGLIASVLIVVVSKTIGKLGLMRRETFYDS